ncbi:MAG: Cobaltochelatase, partial [Frankiales bacterium]|nr:Cobaltochelatase [Frankiales bacterium]
REAPRGNGRARSWTSVTRLSAESQAHRPSRNNGEVTRILLLSTSDTDLLSARASGANYALAAPGRFDLDDLPGMVAAADVVVVRILGGRRAWTGLDVVLEGERPVVVLTGEMTPDAELMEASTVPIGVAAQAHDYLAQGGPANLAQLHAFLSDTIMLTGIGFEPPVQLPSWGPLVRTAKNEKGPVVGILYYRAHHVAGNTAFIEALADAVEAQGGIPRAFYAASLRTPEDELLQALEGVDALITTVLAAGGTRPALASAGEDDEAWDVGALAGFDVPILQALALTSSRATWVEGDEGLSPLDTATQVAIPEFDGRIITVPFSFKEVDEDGLTVYVPDLERCARVAGLAVSHGRLSHLDNADKHIGIVLSAYPTKHSRIGNAVGLDTPASVVRLLKAMEGSGYDVGDLPGYAEQDGDALIHALIAAGGQDPDWLTEAQLQGNPIRIPAAAYRSWFSTLPLDFQEGVEKAWGPAPGDLYVDRSTDPDGEIVVAALQSGNVTLVVQPPRGFGANPVAIYHDPDLPPSHHYLAAYQWLSSTFHADALVHVGKHGNLEWLPGKALGMSASCGTDAALGNLPLVYPFLVNDPGEGSQAKRRAHATLVDHLVPPMARAESYGDLARLEQLLDEHANIAAMDPAKLPAIRAQIWTLIQAARLDHDLGLDDRPHDTEFDDFLLHVDGWLCEVKDVQIRDGLHVLGQAPTGEARALLVLAILRSRQLWSGKRSLPGLRQALGLDDETLVSTDQFEEQAKALVLDLEAHDWDADRIAHLTGDETVADILRFACEEVVPRLAKTTDELTNVLHALDGGYVPAGPSGSPLRGLVNVLPTGRNFYSVDPQAVPSKLAWETGQAMAESLVERYLSDHGAYPTSVGLSAWGTSAMRTSGDDVAEALALLGIRPVWDEASRRVRSLEPISTEELGRPRIDVTIRISGFFRDAFPHVVAMLDDAVQLAAGQDEPDELNYVRAHVQQDTREHGDARRATLRVFGSRPGAYGAGLLPLLDAGNWRDDKDLAEVYAVWGGFAYGRGLDGVPARPDMESAYKRLSVAAKNVDTVEHDILDSSDYLEYHGGMVAMARALTGKAPEAYIGDSTNPDRVRTRNLVEETSRIFRARVVNPRWVEAMRRHGYKGAFELAATVDYLFGYDATTGVVTDHMYETLAQTYVLDETNREFLQTSNPWALHGMTAKLLEAVDRGMWAEPDSEVLADLKATFLATEGDLEGD